MNFKRVKNYIIIRSLFFMVRDMEILIGFDEYS